MTPEDRAEVHNMLASDFEYLYESYQDPQKHFHLAIQVAAARHRKAAQEPESRQPADPEPPWGPGDRVRGHMWDGGTIVAVTPAGVCYQLKGTLYTQQKASLERTAIAEIKKGYAVWHAGEAWKVENVSDDICRLMRPQVSGLVQWTFAPRAMLTLIRPPEATP